VSDGVDFYRHQLGGEELESFTETLRSLFLTTGPRTKAFEDALAERLGVDHVVGVSSCTAGLFLSVSALDIGPGDEVITTPMTFIATSNTVLHAGATPVFVDVEPRTGNLDVANVGAAITERTKAVMPVHLYGQMVDMKALKALCDARGLRILEDAAHALEAERDGAKPGQLGDTASFSFYATKNVSCGEGGAIAVRDDDLAERLRRIRNHGMSKDAYGRYHGAYRHWDMVDLGFKANLPDVLSSLLLPQLAKIDAKRDARGALHAAYAEALAPLVERGLVELPEVRDDSVHSHHLFTIWVAPDRRDEVLGHMQQAGVGVAVNYRAVHLLTYYRERFGFEAGAFPHAERIGDSTLSLPFYPTMDPAEVPTVVGHLSDALGFDGA